MLEFHARPGSGNSKHQQSSMKTQDRRLFRKRGARKYLTGFFSAVSMMALSCFFSPSTILADSYCMAEAGGSSGPVQQPVLRQTLPGSWDENWLASPSVADINGDGKPEIIAPRHSVLYVWKNDGTLLWKTAFGYSASSTPDHGTTRMWPSAAIADYNGDGKPEIAVAGGIESNLGINLCVYDGNGEVLAGWPKRFGDLEVRSIAAADVNGDGRAEILVNRTGAGPVTAVYSYNGTLLSGWPQVTDSCNPPTGEACWDFGGYNQNIGAGDLDGDGVDDVISTYDAIGFGVFRGNGAPFPTAPEFSDRVITAVEAYHDLVLSLQGWGTGDRSEFTSSPPVVADLFGDGEIRIILAGDHEHTLSTENKGTTVWVLNRDLRRPDGWLWPKDTGVPLGGSSGLGSNIVHTMPSPSVADLDGSTGLEILVPGYDGKLHVYRPDGSVYWTYTFSTMAAPYTGASEALVADLNGDSVPEVIFTTFSSGEPRVPETTPHLVILSNTGSLLYNVALSGRGSMAPPTVADIDGDGTLEIIISLKDSLGGNLGGVQIWDVPGSGSNCVLWGTGRGGNLRKGTYNPSSVPSTPPELTINPVASPANDSNQTVTGTVDAGATVTVSTDTTASHGTASVSGTNWSFNVTGLAWGDNNLTVTAKYWAGDATVRSATITRYPKLTVTVDGNGGGTVSSSPQGISCLEASCSAIFPMNTSITLMASHDANSLFTGWSACSGTGDCSFVMNGDRNTSATFSYVQPARTAGSTPVYYSLLSDACNALTNGGTVQAREYQFNEDLTLGRPVPISLEGGYDLTYSTTGGYTILKGKLIVQSGSMTVDNLDIR